MQQTIRLLRIAQVLELIPIRRSTLYRWVEAGRFPAPVRLGENSVAWRESDVSAFIVSLEPAQPHELKRGGRLKR